MLTYAESSTIILRNSFVSYVDVIGLFFHSKAVFFFIFSPGTNTDFTFDLTLFFCLLGIFPGSCPYCTHLANKFYVITVHNVYTSRGYTHTHTHKYIVSPIRYNDYCYTLRKAAFRIVYMYI